MINRVLDSDPQVGSMPKIVGVISGIGWQLLTNRPLPPRFPALFHLVPCAVFGETEGEGMALVLGEWNQNLLSYYPETNNPKIFVVENQKISFRTGDPIKKPSIVNPQVSIQPVRYLWMDFKYGYFGSWVNICIC